MTTQPVTRIRFHGVAAYEIVTSSGMRILCDPFLDQNPGALTKPRVKLFFSTKSGEPIRPEILDLATATARDEIESPEPPENWKFPYLNELWDGRR